MQARDWACSIVGIPQQSPTAPSLPILVVYLRTPMSLLDLMEVVPSRHTFLDCFRLREGLRLRVSRITNIANW